MLVIDCQSWCIYALYKDGTYQPISQAYRSAHAACKQAKIMGKTKGKLSNIESFVVCRRNDHEVLRVNNGTGKVIVR